MAHQGFGFCEFLTEDDAEYACRIMNGIKLFGKPIRVNKVRGVWPDWQAGERASELPRVSVVILSYEQS